MTSFSDTSYRSPVYKWLAVLFVLAIATFGTLPNYFGGQWNWEKVPELSQIEQLQTLQQQGLTLPGWRTLEQNVTEIGGHSWSVQAIVPETAETATAQNTVLLMLRPQTWHRDMPQVDWIDINGVRQWIADSQQSLQFTVPSSALNSAPTRQISVKARFLRGWSPQRTYAVLQWYAWSEGGSPAPGRWFLVDQWSQWHDRRHTSWVAVSLLIPIQPLGDIETARPQAEALGQLVQSALMVSPLSPDL